jgi:Haemolymph juvenile hormone binding protein (JHBP)
VSFYFPEIFEYFERLFSLIDNVDIKIKFKPNVIEKGDGKQYLQVPSNKFKMVFETSHLYLQLENLFNNKALSDNMNKFINENWQIILSELKPSVRDTLATIVSGIINSVFEKLAYEDFYSDTTKLN